MYLIEILHQTTTLPSPYSNVSELYLIEILHQTTTVSLAVVHYVRLYLIEILHQTTTFVDGLGSTQSCILSKFYIKPQRAHKLICRPPKLYLIEILHQTTTSTCSEFVIGVLYLIEILHQTTTTSPDAIIVGGCILSKFYIKPQLRRKAYLAFRVVSYRNSTSNHNLYPVRIDFIKLYLIEILHQTTTRSSTPFFKSSLYLIEILHQTTTEIEVS